MAIFVGFSVVVSEGNTVGARHFAAASGHRLGVTLALAHGAGAGQASAFMVDMATGLAGRGLDVVTFDFPYMERRRRLPDPRATLEATWRAVVAAVRLDGTLTAQPLVIGGKSMGGRIASQVAALPGPAVAGVAALVFLGYPLHPPGRPDTRRDAHLPAIETPMLFVQGERDAFGSADELRALVATLSRADLHVVPGADHSLAAPRRARAASPATGLGEIQDTIVEWIRRVVPV